MKQYRSKYETDNKSYEMSRGYGNKPYSSYRSVDQQEDSDDMGDMDIVDLDRTTRAYPKTSYKSDYKSDYKSSSYKSDYKPYKSDYSSGYTAKPSRSKDRSYKRSSYTRSNKDETTYRSKPN